MLATTRKTYTEARTLSGYYAKTEERISDLTKSVDVMNSSLMTVKQAATSCFPWQSMSEVNAFARRKDMLALRIRTNSVPFKGIRSYPTDVLTAVFSRSLIAFDYTWPSSQYVPYPIG